MSSKHRIAFFLPSLDGGGAERVMVTVANGFAARGHKVDLVLAQVEGSYLKDVSKCVRVVGLNTSRVITSLPGLIRYLRRERPAALLSAMGHTNVVALAARMLARVSTRIVVSEHANYSTSRANANTWRSRVMIHFLRIAYPRANGIVAVSSGVADDLAAAVRIPRSTIKVIYNPVVSDSLRLLAQQKAEHPWLSSGHQPVVLGVGRLSAQKDFPTLIKAFARLCKIKESRLIILGEGSLRSEIEALIHKLGLDNLVALPGFVVNPFAYMRASDVLVLSSAWEGFGNVLAEAMGCGTAVISTDCPSGPAEILEDGKWGRLVPVGDVDALTNAMAAALDDPEPPNVEIRAADFNIYQALEGYSEILFRDEPNP